jgi:predicted site-specific integrase-resolvase
MVLGEPASISPSGITAVDARVSSADQAGDLDRQVARVTA